MGKLSTIKTRLRHIFKPLAWILKIFKVIRTIVMISVIMMLVIGCNDFIKERIDQFLVSKDLILQNIQIEDTSIINRKSILYILQQYIDFNQIETISINESSYTIEELSNHILAKENKNAKCYKPKSTILVNGVNICKTCSKIGIFSNVVINKNLPKSIKFSFEEKKILAFLILKKNMQYFHTQNDITYDGSKKYNKKSLQSSTIKHLSNDIENSSSTSELIQIAFSELSENAYEESCFLLMDDGSIIKFPIIFINHEILPSSIWIAIESFDTRNINTVKTFIPILKEIIKNAKHFFKNSIMLELTNSGRWNIHINTMNENNLINNDHDFIESNNHITKKQCATLTNDRLWEMTYNNKLTNSHWVIIKLPRDNLDHALSILESYSEISNNFTSIIDLRFIKYDYILVHNK